MSETLEETGLETEATETAVGAETDASGAAETTVETPAAAPEINWDDLNVLNAAAERIAALGYTIAPVGQTQQEQVAPETPAYDPFDPQSVERYIAHREQQLEERLVQRFAPVEQSVRAQQAEQVANLIDTRIGAAISANELPVEGFDGGEQQVRQVVNALANSLAADRIASLGRAPYAGEAQRLGEQCITDAVKLLKGYGDARSTAGVEAYKKSFDGEGNFLEPGIRGTGVEGTREYQSEMDVVRSRNFNR